MAKAARVSESTVSRALSNSPLLPQGTKDRVKRTAEALGYVPSRQAMRFARRKTYHIGFVVRIYPTFSPFSRTYFPTLLDGAVGTADSRDYSVTIIPDHSDGKPKDLVRVVRSRDVDGLLLPIVPIDDARLDALLQHAVPFVLINDYRSGCYGVDNRPGPGMRKAFEYAWKLGHRRYGYITGDMRYRNARDRLEIFNSLALEYGAESLVEEGDFSRTSGYRMAGRLLQGETPPTIVMTGADRQAIGVLEYCRDHAIAVPGFLSVVGYDNLAPAGDVIPGLTTVDNPVLHSGEVAARMLIDIIENKLAGPVTEWLDTSLVIRQSTARSRTLTSTGG